MPTHAKPLSSEHRRGFFMPFLPIFPTTIPLNPNQTPILAHFSISDYVDQRF